MVMGSYVFTLQKSMSLVQTYTIGKSPKWQLKKLWVLLAQKELNKKKLMQMTGIGTSSMAKFTKGENVTTDIPCRIYKELDCDFKDIMEYIPDI